MKVYVFTYHQSYDCEFLGVFTKVFSTREKALEAFRRWRDDEMEFVTRDSWEIGVNTEDSFEAYEDGRYCTNHTEGFVEECEVL